MPLAEIDIEVYCDTCGAGLCNESHFAVTRTRQQPSLRVNVCESCIEAAEQRGYDRGIEEARQDD